MEMIEAKVALQYGHYANKDAWEQARFIALTTIKPHIKGNPSVEFYWEKNHKGSSVSDYDRERLRLKAKQYINKINNG